jgi:serine/threonine-protein kinase
MTAVPGDGLHPGDDLKTVVERKDKLNPELIIKWAVELGNALTYLHNRKPPIFHRDIKPPISS